MKVQINETEFKEVVYSSMTMAQASAKLGLHFNTFKKYAIEYGCYEPNQAGKGIPKHLVGAKKEPALEQILNGQMDPSHFNPEKIKNRLIYENKIAEDCSNCGFCERRVTDYKIPLLLNFKDNNKRNYRLDNLELLCYNCYYLLIGDVFTPEQVDKIESFTTNKYNVAEPDFQLSEDQIENMKALGIL